MHSVRLYLVDCLRIPPDRILVLTDSEATREAILQAFQNHFIHNNHVTGSDAMLFYFAGHGSRVVAPAKWMTDDGHVETICPHDESVSPDDQPNVFGIPARTVWALVHELASVKCSNITTILDCCHSGNGIRGRTARRHENRVVIPANLDEGIWGLVADRHVQAAIPSRFLHKNMSSQVLLAACCQVRVIREHLIV